MRPFLTDVPEAPADPRIVVLPCPYDGTSTYEKGADRGPACLIEAAPQLEPYDMELRRAPAAEYGTGVADAVVFPTEDPEAAVQAIERAATPLHRAGKFVVGLGGEHSVTVGLTRAARTVHGPFHVLQIDAHADLRDSYEGSPYNHACVMRRLAEDDLDSRIASVGIRACCAEEVAYAEQRGILTIAGHDLDRVPDWEEEVLRHLRSPVYVTIDLDGLDPSIMPSTGTPVPGGIGWYQTLRLLRRVGQQFDVIAADLTELKPDPVNHHSQFLAAQLAYKIMGYFVKA